MHLTTGTHVAQICWFQLTESRHVPTRLAQTGPPRDDTDGAGKRDITDLDLSRRNALQQRVDLASRDDSNLQKGGIETRSPADDAGTDRIERIERMAGASDAPILLLGESGTGADQIAPFDRVQLAEVRRTCRGSTRLSDAGRHLLAVSRGHRTSTNDADRLRKYTQRFGLDRATVTS
ncbi:RNA repair transcriptional activator RtcR family protein [Sinirhodobacter huangdaonensis]|uniref:RNA repair transcriptional activator RtcR family protein n=1 Tax=Paenirhodobacter huangdaonensis TaxID=2501515 RepID=UPI001EEFB9DB|nr:RNA repair transcriptional activator RtcR family protein [Sinirhodobacter huangdaonensis]